MQAVVNPEVFANSTLSSGGIAAVPGCESAIDAPPASGSHLFGFSAHDPSMKRCVCDDRPPTTYRSVRRNSFGCWGKPIPSGPHDIAVGRLTYRANRDIVGRNNRALSVGDCYPVVLRPMQLTALALLKAWIDLTFRVSGSPLAGAYCYLITGEIGARGLAARRPRPPPSIVRRRRPCAWPRRSGASAAAPRWAAAHRAR